ncbi:MAG: CHASE2 domain-containing protein [Reyranellaceae bacterium]
MTDQTEEGKSGRIGRRLSWLLRRLPTLVPLMILAAALVVNAANPRFIRQLTSFTFDSMQRLMPRTYDPEIPVRVVDIDDESLRKLGQFPWPRTTMAEIFVRLTNAGAAAIVFDGVLAEPDRTSPAAVAREIPTIAADPELRARLAGLPDNDAVLAEVLAQANVVLGFSPTDVASGREPVRKAGMAFAGDDPRLFLRPWPGAITNLEKLEKATAGVGSITTEFGSDNTIRGVPLFFRIGDKLYPSLVAEAIRVAQGASTYVIKSSNASQETGYGEQTGIVSVKIGQFEPLTDGLGQLLLYDTGPRDERFISVADVMSESFDEKRVEGMILFVGSSAPGLKDLRVTPLDPVAPGVVVHAQLAEQIIGGVYLQRPDLISGAEFVYLLVIGLLMVFLLPRLGAAWSGAAAVLLIGGALALSWFAFVQFGWLVDAVYPSGVLLILFISGTMFSYIRSEAERRQVRDAFSLYLAPELVREVAADPSRLRLGGEEREVTVMFTDIRRFTTISESLKPAELTRFLNGFLTPMTDIIQSKRGTIDKYMGDAIMAFWNAPLDDVDHAANACRAALEMRERLGMLNSLWRLERGEDSPAIEIGIGLNTGPAAVGNFGSDRRMAYSVIGDSVNLSSRLESQTKAYGVDALISEETQKRAPGFAVVELDLLRVKGKREPARIFALMGDSDRRQDSGFAALADAQARFLAAYRAGEFGEAAGLLDEAEQVATAFGWQQHYYDVMRARLQRLVSQPPETWDGVFEATEK